MTTKSARVLLAAVLLATSATSIIITAPPAFAQRAPTLSIPVATYLRAVQAALAKKDYKAATDAIASANAVSGKTPFDDYNIQRMAVPTYSQAGDAPNAAIAAYAAADSPLAPDADKAGNYTNALLLAMNTKQYDKAAKYAHLLEPLNPTDPLVLQLVGQAYYLGGDLQAAKAQGQKRVDADIAAGRLPDRKALQLVLSADAQLKDEAGAEVALETLVASYNDPADWAQMVEVTFGTKGLRDLDAVWLGRLLFLTGAPVSANNGLLIGSIAGHLTFFGDAQNAKAHGAVVDPDPGPRAEADKRTIPAQITAAQKANGTFNAKLAEALYSYGMYPEAEAQAKAAIAKGGNPDSSEGPMVLGQAQAAQGKYDEALASFGQVTGGGPATARITRLWIDYVKIKKSPPAAAPAQAAAK